MSKDKEGKGFVHLHVHSDYSIDGLSSAYLLVQEAKRLGMRGIAITDHGTLAGVPEMVNRCNSEGIKPIIGCEFWLAERMPKGTKIRGRFKAYHLILLARNLSGYRNLVKLSSLSGDQGLYRGKPHICHEWLGKYHEGLICTSACIGGEIPQAILAGDSQKALDAAKWYQAVFGEDFYLEVSLHKPHGRTPLSRADNRAAWREHTQRLIRLQARANEGLFAIGQQLGIKVVATNDAHFATKEDAIAQDVVLCANVGKKVSDPNRLRYTHQEYLKSEEEMLALFPDHPEAIGTAAEIFDKIDEFSIREPLRMPKVQDDPFGLLRALALEGATKRYGALSNVITERLNLELAEFERCGAGQLLLILKDVVDYARQNGIAVGPGRGSSPSSLVCYCLGITEVDPLAYGLLFERFISPDRSALPDIDIDFEMVRLQEVVDHLRDRYGEECVTRVCTYGTWTKEGAWLTASKALGVPVNLIEKVLAYTPTVSKLYREGGAGVREALGIAGRLRGMHNGKKGLHACAIVVSPDPIPERFPTTKACGPLATQYEAWDIDNLGGLKLDLLGLLALDIIKETQRLVKESHGVEIRLGDISTDDPQTLQLFLRGDTDGVLMFECNGLRNALRQLRSLNFEDIVALNALFRPGPMVFIPEFIENANLDSTHGVFVYQEQIMKMAEDIAGFSPADADLLRKAICKKKTEVLISLRQKFIQGGIANGHPEDELDRIWCDWEERGKYSFNKSHSVCYSLIAFREAWLKAHYPKEFAQARKAFER